MIHNLIISYVVHTYNISKDILPFFFFSSENAFQVPFSVKVKTSGNYEYPIDPSIREALAHLPACLCT